MPRLPVREHALSPPGFDDRERDALARDLSRAVSGEVRFGLHDRMLYATDASMYQVEPLGVVIPASIDDAFEAVAFCSARGVPILPRGGGTSLAGQCTNRAVVIDFSVNCRAVGEVDRAARRVTVEPGVTLDELNEELARRGAGLFFGPDVATSRHANIGGMIGNNSAGARSVLYGRTVEHVLGLETAVLTADGGAERLRLDAGAGARDGRCLRLAEYVSDVVRRNESLVREKFPKIVRHVDGYNLDLVLNQLDARASAAQLNLAPLVVGSEGTLAVTLGATLNLVPIPRAKGLAVVGFLDLDEAMAAVNPILATRPSAVELLDDMVINLARANTEYRKYVELLPAPAGGDVKAVLYVEYYAESGKDELRERFEQLGRMLSGAPIRTYDDPKSMELAWKLRKAGEPLLHGVPGRRKPLTFVEDTAVDPKRLPGFVRDFRRLVERHGTKAAFYAHASVGCLHIRPLLDPHDAADVARMQVIAEEVADLVRAYEGALSGEHGDGRVRSPLLERYFGPELMEAFREIKEIFDPRGLLNPGNIVGQESIGSISVRTRVNPDARPSCPVRFPSVDTFFDYHDQHGFDGAVEMCNGSGVCRKKRGGTMCPSYMATLDERHSTRGRGNALRLAITGQLDPAPQNGAQATPMWSDEETIRTLDLCLSCKACKTECPSNVDIARLKAEFTAQRYVAAGAPLSARIMGEVRTLNRLGALAPALANSVSALAPVRAIINRLLGMHPDRSLPRFERSLFARFRRRESAGAPNRRRVVLYADCFTAYNEPGIGAAAVRLLEHLGYEVHLPDVGCCGRPKISLGLLPSAVREIDATLELLAPLARDPSIEAILVLEPSCLSAFKDDHLQLNVRTSDDARRAIAAKAMLVEEFVEKRWDAHPRPAGSLGAADGPAVLLHGHCHQKALWGVETSAALLRRLVGARLRVLDSGCCGMAGSFGYTPGRYDLSMKIGELALFPAVRADPEAVVVAPGTSCRHQLHDGVGRRALHPVEFAAAILAPEAGAPV